MRSWDSTDSLAAALGHGRAAFVAALQAGNAAAASDAYADDATLVAPAAEVLRGRGAIERFWRTGVETGVRRVDLSVIDLQGYGDVALEIGRYALHLAPEGGGGIVDQGRYLIVHRPDGDGRWRRCAEMFSPDRPPTHEPSPEEVSP